METWRAILVSFADIFPSELLRIHSELYFEFAPMGGQSYAIAFAYTCPPFVALGISFKFYLHRPFAKAGQVLGLAL